MWRMTSVSVFLVVLAACASHGPVKVTCSGHLVRINAESPVVAKTAQPPTEIPAAAVEPASPPTDHPQ